MMSSQPIPDSAPKPPKVWLLSKSGSLAGTRFPLRDATTRVGRAPDNDAVLDGADCATVSLYHLEIVRDGGSWRVRDLGSTNGTWIEGERITEAEISLPATIQLGNAGPELEVVLEEPVPAELDRTLEIARSAAVPPPAAAPLPVKPHEELLSSAVNHARRMRAHGVGGQTMTIMRDVLDAALRYNNRRYRIVGYSLLLGLLAVSSFATWKITALKNEKHAIDTHIEQLEAELQKSDNAAEMDNLLSRLNEYQNEAQSLEGTLLYRIGGATRAAERTDFVTRELRAVMADFGAEVYSIPPDFVERVKYHIEQDQGPERPLIARALSDSHDRLQTIRRMLRDEQLPPDLAYIAIVESAINSGPASAAGAVGPWQFTAATAKAYGLRVDGATDERKDLVKSTRASCKYLRDLILDFGAGSSVMLALAAYNSGPTKVKQAVSKAVRDPIKQRNFWYLYRVRALPLETREYVPKVFAVILIGRNPEHFGF
jgi:pSer/pThr/pTyr-binding forkhead associated (FHA) protein